MLVPLVSCGGGGGGSVGGATGTLSVSLTDDPGDYASVFVTIDEVQVKKVGAAEGESGWVTVGAPGKTFDLLELQNGVIAGLGLAEIEAGQYNQMRLILGAEPDDQTEHPYANYLIIEGDGGDPVELKVPSGFQTGIKIIHGFTIVADGATELILDFDADKSVHKAGNSGQRLMKPTIKVLDTLENSVSGTVDPARARISAQIYDADADYVDRIAVVGGSVSDENGDYLLYLPPDTYNIVATKAGYVPECQVVEAAPGYQNYTAEDFTLAAAETTGTITGVVTGLPEADDSAFFSIRQADDTCGMIEVASASVVNENSSAPITLPAGTTYQVVVSAGETIWQGDIEVIAGENTNVVFP